MFWALKFKGRQCISAGPNRAGKQRRRLTALLQRLEDQQPSATRQAMFPLKFYRGINFSILFKWLYLLRYAVFWLTHPFAYHFATACRQRAGQNAGSLESFLENQGYSSYEEVIGEALPSLMGGSEIYVTPSVAAIDSEKCVSCGKCFDLGHCDAVKEEDGRYAIKTEECIGCGICAVVCPKEAIGLRRAI